MEVLWKENNIFYNILCVLITENEKLFDRSDARLYWKTVFHMTTVFHHMYVVIFARGVKLESDAVEIHTLKRFRVGYLTGWNFTFQTTFLCVALSYDVLQWIDKHDSTVGKQIRYMREIVFNGLVVPFTCFVSSMFWAVYAIDRELVFPKVYDDIMPWWLNHCVHTNIVIVLAIETILQSRRYPTDAKVETGCFVFISILYAVVYYSIFFFAHVWLYGVFGVMTWWQVCLYQLVIWASAYIFYHMMFIINRMIHGPENLEEICPKETDGEQAQDLKKFGSGVNGRSQIRNENEVPKDGRNVDANESNVNIKNEVENEEVSKLNGSDFKSNDFAKVTKSNERNVTNGDVENSKINDVIVSHNGVQNNGKDWKSIENNGVSELDGASNTFDKSWSAKYRTNRIQFENSSL